MRNKEAVKALLSKAQKDGRDTLLENEVYEVLKIIGINTPKYMFIPSGQVAGSILNDSGSEVVVKVVSPQILHKTELGGVMFCGNDISEINGCIKKIAKATSKYNVHGFIIVEKVEYAHDFGNELIVSVRNTKDFGTLIGFGAGGINTEFFTKRMEGSFSIISGDHKKLTATLIKNNAAYYAIAGLGRTKKRLCEDKDIVSILEAVSELGRAFSEESGSEIVISELELNPVVISDNSLVAIDALMKFRDNIPIKAGRPLRKLENLLHPQSIAIIGVSQKNMNMGRIILNNIISRGFDISKLHVIKQDAASIDGINCVPALKELPSKVDLLVIALSATETPSIIKQAIDYNLAESIIIIPGGFSEKEGSQGLEKEILSSIETSRSLPGEGPVIVGGNCLGAISNSGLYDSFFIPVGKIEYSAPSPYAFISQSGAFIISKISKTGLTPEYALSIGNQMDLTFSDYLSYFKDVDGIKVIAGYIEGFKDLDGIRSARIIRELRDKGKDVLIYKGGTSGEGKAAASSHTASMAGDFYVFNAVMRDAGALVAETFTEFEDLLKLSVMFSGLKDFGLRLSLLSNAGFESVGMADRLNGARLADISASTKDSISRLLAKEKIDKLVAVKNPLDITPVASDDMYIGCAELLLNDKNTDAMLISCIPMTSAIKSIGTELDSTSMFYRLNSIWKSSRKPFVVVVDCGSIYDQACSLLKGIPVFKEADRAISSLIKYLSYKGGSL